MIRESLSCDVFSIWTRQRHVKRSLQLRQPDTLMSATFFLIWLPLKYYQRLTEQRKKCRWSIFMLSTSVYDPVLQAR